MAFTNYGAQKRAKEAKRLQKQEEKRQRLLARKQAAQPSAESPAAGDATPPPSTEAG